jgi:hypothetical protein
MRLVALTFACSVVLVSGLPSVSVGLRSAILNKIAVTWRGINGSTSPWPLRLAPPSGAPDKHLPLW